MKEVVTCKEYKLVEKFWIFLEIFGVMKWSGEKGVFIEGKRVLNVFFLTKISISDPI